MADSERIYVAETTAGKGASGTQGRAVSLPVVELLTGRGFVTGKSGSGKSNTASVLAEELLDSGFGLLIVDVDGEYYGLKEEYEILHAGADEECDVQVTADHAEKLAGLALERNVPIILDVSGFLDEEEADAVLAAIAKHLFAKAKKRKQPFLLLVEEVHEYIPENGSVGEAGKMLIKIGKRGRKHGLGVCGISQRPADVKKDYITQCDWLVWHRLTWNNDTKVVRRVLDGEYASAVEDLDDGEGFLATDWSERVRRVKFRRKRTFDAGATPGLDDFERPDLKSVSDELVSELATIGEQEQSHDDRLAALRGELDEKNSRIAELEAELQDARDLSRMADQFVNALLEHVEGAAPGRTERERQRRRRQGQGSTGTDDAQADRTDGDSLVVTGGEAFQPSASGGATDEDVDDAMAAFGAMMNGDAAGSSKGTADGDSTGHADGESPGQAANGSADRAEPTAGTNGEDSSEVFEGLAGLAALGSNDGTNGNGATRNGTSDGRDRSGGDVEAAADGGLTVRSFSTEVADFERGAGNSGLDEADESAPLPADDGRPAVVRRIDDALSGFDEPTLAMIVHYREQGPDTPEDAARVATERGDRNGAYARNRKLRMAGLIEHVGRGNYDYCLVETIEAAIDDPDRQEDVAEIYARDLEQEYLE